MCGTKIQNVVEGMNTVESVIERVNASSFNSEDIDVNKKDRDQNTSFDTSAESITTAEDTKNINLQTEVSQVIFLKIFSIMSAFTLIVLLTTKWIYFPLLNEILYYFEYTANSYNTTKSISLLDISAFILKLLPYFNEISSAFSGDLKWVIIILFAVSVISIITCIYRILRFLYYLLNNKNIEKYYDSYRQLIMFFFSMCGTLLLLVFGINWFLNDGQYEGFIYISLTPMFYITAAITIISRLIIYILFKEYIKTINEFRIWINRNIWIKTK